MHDAWQPPEGHARLAVLNAGIRHAALTRAQVLMAGIVIDRTLERNTGVVLGFRPVGDSTKLDGLVRVSNNSRAYLSVPA